MRVAEQTSYLDYYLQFQALIRFVRFKYQPAGRRSIIISLIMHSDDAAAAGGHPAEPAAFDLYFLEPPPEPITPEREQQLRSQATKFHQLYEDLNANFYEYENFYVVSMKWLKRWKVYTSYDEAIKGEASTKFIGSGQLPILNEDILDNDFQIDIVFEEPNQGLNLPIVQGLKSEVDYVLVNKPLWEILEEYKNIEFNRKMVVQEEGKKVEVYYRRITAILLSNEILKDVEKETLKKFKRVNLQLPQYTDIEPLIPYISEKVRDFMSINPTMYKYIDYSQDNVKIWLVDEDMTENKLKENFYKGCKSNRSFSYKLHFPGTQINLNGTTLSKLEFSPKTLIAFELKEKKEEWVFFTKESPLIAKCDYCKTWTSLTVFCSCMYACYCSKDCKNKDKTSHKIRCDREAESSEEEKTEQLTEYSRRGRMGLSNLGNTCFMNSGIQCITAIEELSEYFFTKAFIPEINTSNPLGTKGELSTAYGKLIQKILCGSESYISPSVLKRAIGKFQPMFVGYEQHDSGELISYLLDGLHEDLNRIKVKPYVETKNHDGRPDNVLSKQGWEGFLQRNQSKIVDLLFGQYKSKLHCPKCNNESITFDPFMMYPLPIPQSNKKVMEIILMKNHVESIKLNLMIEKSPQVTLQTLMDELAQRYKVSNRMIVSGSSYYSCEVFDNSKEANEIRKEFKHKHILFRPLEAHENLEKDEPVNIQHCLCHSQYGNESYRRNITYQRAYLFNKTDTTKQIHLKLFSYYKDHLKVEDYEEEIIKVPAADQRWRIHIVTNSKFDACYFCGQTGCENCVLPFSDEITLADLLAKIKPGRTEHKFELEIYWRKGDTEVEKAFEKVQKEYSGGANVGEESVDISDCFKLAQEPETLDAQNEWYCPTCQEFVLAVKQLTLYKAPKVLICYFKRFKGKGYKGMMTSKLTTHINFPLEDLDINEFLVDKQLPGVYHEGNMQVENHVKYDLFAVSNHYGGLGGGHYTAFAKKNGQWDEYDDSSVRPAEKSQIISSAAYVLFYKRKDV